MDLNILFFFILPLAVIILSIALQKLLDSPILVSAIIFITFILIAYIITDLTSNLIIAGIAYSILSFLTSLTYYIISCIIDRLCNMNNNTSNGNTNPCIRRLCCRRRICNNRRNS